MRCGLFGEDKSGSAGECSRLKFGVEGILGSLQWRGTWRVDDCDISLSISSPKYSDKKSLAVCYDVAKSGVHFASPS